MSCRSRVVWSGSKHSYKDALLRLQIKRGGGGVEGRMAYFTTIGQDFPANDCRMNQQRTDHVYVGGEFERLTLCTLNALGHFIDLQRVGGAGDQGVDLYGRLSVATAHVIVQCKKVNRPLGPRLIRELEGTLLAHQQHGQTPHPTIDQSGVIVGIMVSNQVCSAQSKRALMSSRFPMAAMCLLEDGVQEGFASPTITPAKISSILMNPALQSAIPGWIAVFNSKTGVSTLVDVSCPERDASRSL